MLRTQGGDPDVKRNRLPNTPVRAMTLTMLAEVLIHLLEEATKALGVKSQS